MNQNYLYAPHINMQAGRLPIVIDPKDYTDMSQSLTTGSLMIFGLSEPMTHMLYERLATGAGALRMRDACHLFMQLDPVHMGRELHNFMTHLPTDFCKRVQKSAEVLLCQSQCKEHQGAICKLDCQLNLLVQIPSADVTMVRLELQNKRDDIVREMERIQQHMAVLLA